jgi:aminoglycoside phosphotransferase (APT) family kinase protein
MSDDAPGEVGMALRRMGLLEQDERPRFTPLAGGVSSDIWRVDLRRGPICVKRALAKLKVAQDWQAPVERNLYEAAWMKRAAAVVPEAVPEILGQDREAGVLAMTYLDPAHFRSWKALLLEGRIDPDVAAAVGDRLGRIHAATAADEEAAWTFATDRIFYEIRLEPYLIATGRAHRDLAEALQTLVEVTAASKFCLVHGDVSPKNILLGPGGPVFLDAECAWFGDPAFDLAFCLNHFLLKGVRKPLHAPALMQAFRSLTEAYLKHVAWEPPDELDGRATRLLPALFLARVDGKSPVEYLTKDVDKGRVRRIARELLEAPPLGLMAVRTVFMRELHR